MNATKRWRGYVQWRIFVEKGFLQRDGRTIKDAPTHGPIDW